MKRVFKRFRSILILLILNYILNLIKSRFINLEFVIRIKIFFNIYINYKLICFSLFRSIFKIEFNNIYKININIKMKKASILYNNYLFFNYSVF